MAEQQVADQFIFWNENLGLSLKEIQGILAEIKYDIPTLEDALNGMQIELEKVQTYQQNPKTNVTYNYKDALPNIAWALRLEEK